MIFINKATATGAGIWNQNEKPMKCKLLSCYNDKNVHVSAFSASLRRIHKVT
jgi:hypothetical protein